MFPIEGSLQITSTRSMASKAIRWEQIEVESKKKKNVNKVSMFD